jgi:hypothetical protein
MWIRSQDKEILINDDIIYYCAKYGMFTEIKCGKLGISDDYDVVLAAYSTKEKALKVLNKIQKHICDYQLEEVFQMPQDNEVEACKKITASVVLKYQKEAKKITMTTGEFKRLGRELCDIYGLTDGEAIDILNNNNVLEILRKYEEVEA